MSKREGFNVENKEAEKIGTRYKNLTRAGGFVLA